MTAVAFCGCIWLEVRGLSAPNSGALDHHPSRRAVRDLLVLGASVARLAAVALVLLAAHWARPPASVLLAALGLVSVAVSCCTVRMVFMLRNALFGSVILATVVNLLASLGGSGAFG